MYIIFIAILWPMDDYKNILFLKHICYNKLISTIFWAIRRKKNNECKNGKNRK